MGVDHMVITVTSQQYIFDADKFLQQAQHRWPECSPRRYAPETDTLDAEVSVRPPGAPSFDVRHFPSRHMVATDAQPWVAAEVAAWVRSLHPEPDLVLWFIDEGFSGHTVLFPGITAEEVLAGWVDHAEHDPYTEYPDYFK